MNNNLEAISVIISVVFVVIHVFMRRYESHEKLVTLTGMVERQRAAHEANIKKAAVKLRPASIIELPSGANLSWVGLKSEAQCQGCGFLHGVSRCPKCSRGRV
jgi:hypothetical protein